MKKTIGFLCVVVGLFGSFSSFGDDTVNLVASDGIKLKADFLTPRGTARRPGVIMIHAPGSDRSELSGIAKALIKTQKFGGVLNLDIRGHGASAAAVSWDKAGTDAAQGFNERLWAYAARDLEAANQFMGDQSTVQTTHLYYLVHGAAALGLATQDLDGGNGNEDIRGLVIINPPAPAASAQDESHDDALYGFDPIFGDDGILYSLQRFPIIAIAANKDKENSKNLGKFGKFFKQAEARLEDASYTIKTRRLKAESALTAGKLVADAMVAWIN